MANIKEAAAALTKKTYSELKNSADNAVRIHEREVKYAPDEVNSAVSDFKSVSKQTEKAATKGAKKTADFTKKRVENQLRKTVKKRFKKAAERQEKSALKSANKTIKSSERAVKSVKQTVKSARAAEKVIVKSTEAAAKASAKGAETAAKASAKAAEVTAQAAAKGAEITAQAAAKGAQATAKVLQEAAAVISKIIAAAAKALADLLEALEVILAAAAPIIILVLLVVLVMCLLTGDTAQGINDKTDTEIETEADSEYAEWDRYREYIEYINADWNAQLDALTSGYGSASLSGSRVSWPVIVSIFRGARLASADYEEGKAIVLGRSTVYDSYFCKIFWKMHSLTCRTYATISGSSVPGGAKTYGMKTVESTFSYDSDGFNTSATRIDTVTWQNTKTVSEIMDEYRTYEDGVETSNLSYTTSIAITINTKSTEEGIDWILEDLSALNTEEYHELISEYVSELTSSDMSEFWSELLYGFSGISSGAQQAVVDAAMVTPSPGSNLCALWVSQVYQKAFGVYPGGDGNTMLNGASYFTYGVDDLDTLQVGMAISTRYGSGSLGQIYGHVGIYIGDGYVMENIGSIATTPLETWINRYKNNGGWIRWGYPKAVAGYFTG